jgi:hypothetical protein
MGKRAPKLPVASAGAGEEEEKRPRVGITDPDWQRIESAYGQKLSPQARRDIQGRTQKFVDRDEFEQNAEPVSDARDQIAIVIGAASSLRYRSAESTMPIFTRAASSESISGSRVAKKQKAGHAIKRRRRKDDPLRNISCDMRLSIFASQDALR